MNSRELMLSRIRQGLRRGALDEASRWPLERRLESPAPVLVPASSRLTGEALVERFVRKTQGVDASVALLDRFDEIPAAAAKYLNSLGSDAPIRIAPDPRIASLDWQRAGLTATAGVARDEDAVGVTIAYAGVAESGTLVMTSGAQTPTTLNYLPDDSIIVLRLQDLVGSYEQVWQRLREEFGGRHLAMPRVINWITGPSRTADIEQTLLLGIHGPRRLHVLLVASG